MKPTDHEQRRISDGYWLQNFVLRVDRRRRRVRA